MFPKGGTSNTQQDQRQHFKPTESNSFSQFRDFESEDPISSLVLA